jgi:hypothetical protein
MLPPLCDPASESAAVHFEDDAGTAQIMMTCASGTSILNYVGPLVEFRFACETTRTATLRLTGSEDTFLLDSTLTAHNHHQHDGTIECGEADENMTQPLSTEEPLARLTISPTPVPTATAVLARTVPPNPQPTETAPPANHTCIRTGSARV